MSISKDDLLHLCELAHLSPSEQELQPLGSKLDAILSYFSKLNEINTDSVEPMNYVHPGHSAAREDQVEESMPVNEGLANVPKVDDDFILVPKVIDN